MHGPFFAGNALEVALFVLRLGLPLSGNSLPGYPSGSK